MEYVAETDDALIEKFLEEGELTKEELISGLKKAIKNASIAPVCACASLASKGAATVLDTLVNFFPSPAEVPARQGLNPKNQDSVERPGQADAPFSAQVFKTMADPFAGRLTIFRVFSTKIAGGGTIVLS